MIARDHIGYIFPQPVIIESSSYHNGHQSYGRYEDESEILYDYTDNQDIYNVNTASNNLYTGDYYYTGNEEFVYS